ncbi:hypothetical protein BGZ94_002995 [Podila epigama]|nr:hypothetical protein BGZ94_002995 [Podila epigama]
MSASLIEDLYKKPSSSTTVVTLDDILALKPNNPSNKISPKGFEKIRSLVDSSFNVAQLKGVLRSQNIPATGNKDVLLNKIMALMDLNVIAPEDKNSNPLVEDPYAALKMEANMESQEFPSNKRDLSYLIGSDSDELRELEKKMGVRVSIRMGDNTYTIRGTKEAIEEAKAAMDQMLAVTDESWDISGYLDRALVTENPSVLEEISRHSRTIVSVDSENKIMTISGRTSRDKEEAKRLFDLKMLKPDIDSEMSILLQPGVEESPLGMFPVLDSSTIMEKNNQESYFRICATVPFAENTLNREAFTSAHSSSSLPLDSYETLGQHFTASYESALRNNQAVDLSANFGQVLFRNHDKQVSKMPIPGSFDLSTLKSWLETSEAPMFSQQLPFFKIISKYRLFGEKSRTVEIEYVGSALSGASKLPPMKFTLGMDAEGKLRVLGGRYINGQQTANLMMLSQPTDIQIRSEFSTDIKMDNLDLNDLLRQVKASSTGKLEVPRFFTFNHQQDAGVPVASQIGLAPTYTLKSVLFRTTGLFNLQGLTLVASDVSEQYGLFRMHQLKLLPTRLPTSLFDQEYEHGVHQLVQPSTEPLQNWDEFIGLALDLNKSI